MIRGISPIIIDRNTRKR